MSHFVRFLTLRHLLTRCQVVLTLLPLLLAGCQSQAAKEQANYQVLTVNAQVLGEAGPTTSIDRFTGVIRPHRTSQLAAKSLGRVEKVWVDIGDVITQGQLLVDLDTEQLQASLKVAQANLSAAEQRMSELTTGPRKQDIQQAEAQVKEVRANLDLARSSLERLKPLRESSAISQQEFDEAKYRVEALEAQEKQAVEQLSLQNEGTRKEQLAAQLRVVQGMEAQVDQIEVQLNEQRIYAPYAGQIQLRGVDEGDVVSPGQLLLQIVEAGRLEIEVGIPADLATKIDAGAVDVFVNGKRGTSNELTHPADEIFVTDYASRNRDNLQRLELLRIAPSVDELTRTRTCLFKLPTWTEQEPQTLGGAIEVLVEQPLLELQGYWVPNSALSAGPRGLWALFVLRPEGTFFIVERRPVELLETQVGFTLVRGPIDAEEMFVVDGTHRIVVGQRVKLAERDTSGRSSSSVAQEVSPTKQSVLQ